MRIFLRDGVKRKIRKLQKRYPDILGVLDEVFKLYENYPRHPKLRVHKLRNRINNWSISLRPDLRVVFEIVDEDIRIMDIGSHDEVYR